MMAGDTDTWSRAVLEEQGVGCLCMLWRDMPDVIDRAAAPRLAAALVGAGLAAPDGSLTDRGEEARRAALRLLAERQVSPARIEALSGGDVARWAALADAATPGPLTVSETEHDGAYYISLKDDAGMTIATDLHEEDAALYAEARPAVLALCAEVARLRAALADPQRALVQQIAAHAPAVHSDIVAAVEAQNPNGLTTEQREQVGHLASLVQVSAYTCITGRPEDAARAFAGLLGAAGESEDGRRGAARALMHVALALLGQPVPDINAEVVLAQLDAEVKHKPRDAWDKGYSSGMARAVHALAPYLPVVPRSAR